MHNLFQKNRSVRTESPTGEVAITIIHGQPVFQIEPVERLHDRSKQRPNVHARWAHGLMALFVAFVALPVSADSYTANDIIAKTNAARQAEGIATLQTNQKLNQAAKAKANDMLANGYFSHTSPSGKTPWSWISGAGYAYTEAGENLAKDYMDADGVIAGWLGSSTHRRNLLNPKFRDIGVAVVEGSLDGQTTLLVVQFFGSQKATAPVATTAPDPTPKATPTPAPAARAPVSQPAPAPTPVIQPVVEPRLASLVHADGTPVPTLTFTYQEPDPALRLPRPLQPQVEGARTGFESSPALGTPSSLQRDLPLLMLVAFLAEILAIAGYGLLQSRLPKKLSLAQLGFQVQPIRA